MSARTITIVRQGQQIQLVPGQTPTPGTPGAAQNMQLGYQMVVTASGAAGMPNEIFKMNRRPADPNNLSSPPTDDYQAICMPADLSLPVNNPISPGTLFRVAQVTLTYYSQADADSAWDGIQSSVQNLKSALDQADRLNLAQTFVPI